MKIKLHLVIIGLTVINSYIFAESLTLKSPDQRIEMNINAAEVLSYSVSMNNQPVILDSEMQMEFGDGTFFEDNLELVSSRTESVEKKWNPVVGRKSEIVNKYNELVLELREPSSGREFSLICRAYNSGVAFRYDFGTQFGSNFTIKEEHTEFTFPNDPTAWISYLNSYTTMHETVFPEKNLTDILPGNIIGLPLTMKMGDNLYASVTEAALVDWAGMYITREGSTDLLVETDEMELGEEPYSFNTPLPEGAATLNITVDDLGNNYCDHVDIVDFKVNLEDGSEIWFSDMQPASASQEWGSLKEDRSVDGNPLTIAGVQYEKGLGTHASASIAYKLPENSRSISGKVGIDDEVSQPGSAKVLFEAVNLDETADETVLTTTLSPRHDDSSISVNVSPPHKSPWRVIQIAEKPEDLLNSDIIVNLNPPSKIENTSWIKPGVSSWNWLSSGSDMDMELLKGFIDLSGHMNWEYALIDDGWYQNGDCTNPIDELDIPELVSYAAERDVDLWLWTHWQALNAGMEEAFQLYEDWGIKGVKIDFMSRDDQWMVNWYHRVLESAAEHNLMINFHGAYKPTGERRIWPNMMTSEAVYGNEQSLGSSQNDPVHKTTLPFTRMLAGPMDYTPGSFLNETADTWSGGRPIKTIGTRAQELALFVVYDSLFMCTADKPENYYGETGVEFLKGIPASWDDTIVLDGGIGEFIVTARRKGDNWYLGAITNYDSRTLNIPLDFLGDGKYVMKIWEDGENADTDARDVNVRQITVESGDTVNIDMAAAGGFVAELKKK